MDRFSCGAVADSPTADNCGPFASAQGENKRFVRAEGVPSGHLRLAALRAINPALLLKMVTLETASTF
jgi:hypothetical protein